MRKIFLTIMLFSTASLVLAQENSTATEDIKASYQGNEIEIGFNSRYVMDILDNLEGEEIKISFNDNSNPIMIQEKIDSENIYVLMPMRV